jgi:hypothetical protein
MLLSSRLPKRYHVLWPKWLQALLATSLQSINKQNPAVSQSDAKDECRMYHVIRVEVLPVRSRIICCCLVDCPKCITFYGRNGWKRSWQHRYKALTSRIPLYPSPMPKNECRMYHVIRVQFLPVRSRIICCCLVDCPKCITFYGRNGCKRS